MRAVAQSTTSPAGACSSCPGSVVAGSCVSGQRGRQQEEQTSAHLAPDESRGDVVQRGNAVPRGPPQRGGAAQVPRNDVSQEQRAHGRRPVPAARGRIRVLLSPTRIVQDQACVLGVAGGVDERRERACFLAYERAGGRVQCDVQREARAGGVREGVQARESDVHLEGGSGGLRGM